MGVMTPAVLRSAEVLDIVLQLPDGFTIRASGIVIWDDRHGKSGLSFQCGDVAMRERLDYWLDSQFTIANAQRASR
jgi:hypothetical protein